MLGDIVAALTDTATAEEAMASVCAQSILIRIQAAAATDAVPVGSFVAGRIRHVIEHGGEDIWLDLVGVMAGSPQPGAAAVERMLAYAFPDPIRTRISRAHR